VRTARSRHARGTLAARSGNASDRALQLHDLLDAMGVTSRFAFGDVTPEVAGLLVDQAFDRPAAPLSDPADLRLAGLDGAAIQQRARRDYALLRRALGDRVDAMAPVSIQGALADVVHHTWVQVKESGVWVDYDEAKRAKKILQARMNDKCKRCYEYLLILGCVSIPVYGPSSVRSW